MRNGKIDHCIKVIYRWICIEVFDQIGVQMPFYIILSWSNSVNFGSDDCNFAGNCVQVAF